MHGMFDLTPEYSLPSDHVKKTAPKPTVTTPRRSTRALHRKVTFKKGGAGDGSSSSADVVGADITSTSGSPLADPRSSDVIDMGTPEDTPVSPISISTGSSSRSPGYRFFISKPESKKPLGVSSSRSPEGEEERYEDIYAAKVRLHALAKEMEDIESSDSSLPFMRSLESTKSGMTALNEERWKQMATEMLDKERAHRDAMIKNPTYILLTKIAIAMDVPLKKLVRPTKTYRDTSQWRTQYPKSVVELLGALNKGDRDGVAMRLGDIFASKCIDEASEKMNENELRKQMYKIVNERLLESTEPEMTDYAMGLITEAMDFCRLKNSRIAAWTRKDFLADPVATNTLILAMKTIVSEAAVLTSKGYMNRARIEYAGTCYLETVREIRKLGKTEPRSEVNNLFNFSQGY